jgi:choline dehydrogenase-like flavoprotein
MSARIYRETERVDFTIVGSGAAGGVIARELAQAGLSVVLLEQGPRLTPADFEHDELKYWFLSGITNDPVRNPQTFRNDPASKAELATLRPPLSYARTVGGASLHYTANYWRFHPIDFNERSVLGAIAGTGFDDWPIDYAELEPYYTKVEWEVGVSGLAGASPFDPPRTRPFPMPPLPVKSSGVLFERGARALGMHPFPAPMAINSIPYRGRPACVHCGFCHGFACEVMAKASTLTTTIPEAEATRRCELRSDSYVVRIETDAHGRASGVNYFDGHGHEHFQRSRAVVVCANGAETPRLLLMSANGKFPQGLANSSGLVGKYLMFNYTARVGAVFEHELNEYKSVQVTRILPRFLRFGSEARLLRRRRSRRADRPATHHLGAAAHARGCVVGQRVQGEARGVSTIHGGGLPWHLARGRNEQRHARSRCQRCVGNAGDPRHLQGPSGRSGERTVPPGARRRNHAGCRCPARDEGAGDGTDVIVASARHVPHGKRSGQVGCRSLPPQS